MRFPEGNYIGSDTETTGVHWRFSDRPYCFSFCNWKGETEVIHFPVDPFTRKVIYDSRLEKVKAYYEDPSKTWYFHNAAFDNGMLESIGIHITGKIICTMSLVRLLRSNAPLALKKFCALLGIPNDDEEDLRKATASARHEGKKLGYKIYEKRKNSDDELAPDYWLAGPKYYAPYARWDAARVVAVAKYLLPEIEKEGLEKLWKTELETWKTLRAIENRGIRIDKEKVLNAKIAIKKKFLEYRQDALSQISPLLPLWIPVERKVKGEYKDSVRLIKNPEQVNLNSPQQLSHIFYKRFKMPVNFLTKGKNPSTDNGALMSMKHPLAKTILNARACVKTSEFMAQYLNFMVQHKDDKLWYLHPSFHSSIALTGRESCSNPNLQQVAKGKDENLEVRVEARSVFCARPNYSMWSYDWKNIEVYIPAFESKDKRLVKMLMAGEDAHEYTAKSLTKRTGKTIDRELAKRTFFGLQYGIGAPKMSKTLGISVGLAYVIIDGFSQTYPGLWEWMQDLMLRARRDGYITTMYGRKIFVSPDEAYKGVNYFVQGTAGGILKEAKNKIHDQFKKQDAFIVLPIHDELLNEFGTKINLNKMHKEVVGAMQDNPALHMPVKIPVSVSAIGKNWAEKTKVGVF